MNPQATGGPVTFNGAPKGWITCHLCGQAFGKTSFEKFHLPQCESKFKAQQKQLPKKFRKTLPKRPTDAIEDTRPFGSQTTGGTSFAKMSDKEIDEYNRQQLNAYQTDSLVACSKCGRRFRSDRIEKHEKVCQAKPVRVSASTLAASSSPTQKEFQTPTKKSPKSKLTPPTQQNSSLRRPSPTKPTLSKSPKPQVDLEAPILIETEGIIPYRVVQHDHPEEPFISITIIKSLGVQIEGSGPDRELFYELRGKYSDDDDESDSETLAVSPVWPQGSFRIRFRLNMDWESLPLDQVEKDTPDANTLTLYFKKAKQVAPKKVVL